MIISQTCYLSVGRAVLLNEQRFRHLSKERLQHRGTVVHGELMKTDMHLGTVEMVAQNTLTIDIASFTEQSFLLHVCHRNSDLCLALMLGFNAAFFLCDVLHLRN